jgi:hypothetical protein
MRAPKPKKTNPYWSGISQQVPVWPKTSRAKAQHPELFFSTLPPELWLEISSYLNRVDLKVLRLSFKAAHSFFKIRGEASDLDDWHRFQLLTHQDWLILSDAVCIICKQTHHRPLAQPRSMILRPSCIQGNDAPCKGVLTVTRDKILCQLCWTALLARHVFQARDIHLQDEYCDCSWEHQWRMERRNGSLILKVESSFRWPDNVTYTEITSPEVASFDLLRKLYFMPDCGCHSASGMLVLAMLKKMRLFLKGARSPQRNETYTCIWCGAFYVMKVQRREHTYIILTKYHDLSDATLYALRLHWNQWRNDWKVPGPKFGGKSGNVALARLLTLDELGIRRYLQLRIHPFEKVCTSLATQKLDQ